MGAANTGVGSPPPERSGTGRRRGSAIAKVLTAVAGLLALAYAVLALGFASAFGEGDTTAIAEKRPASSVWFGLPGVGALAALATVVLASRPRRAVWALAISVTCLAAFTMLAYAAY